PFLKGDADPHDERNGKHSAEDREREQLVPGARRQQFASEEDGHAGSASGDREDADVRVVSRLPCRRSPPGCGPGPGASEAYRFVEGGSGAETYRTGQGWWSEGGKRRDSAKTSPRTQDGGPSEAR